MIIEIKSFKIRCDHCKLEEEFRGIDEFCFPEGWRIAVHKWYEEPYYNGRVHICRGCVAEKFDKDGMCLVEEGHIRLL